MTRQGFGPWTYAGCTLGFLILAIYGSLVPFHYRPVAWEDALERWRHIPYLDLGIYSRADFVANILLFIPLSYLMMATLCVDRRRWVGLIWLPVVVVICAGLALAIEFTQIWFWPRTVSLNDIYAETTGGVIGSVAWLLIGQRVTEWARSLWGGWGRGRPVAKLLPAYLVFLVVIHVVPLDLTIRPAELYQKYKEGRVVLVPFSAYPDELFGAAEKLLWNTVYYLPLGLILCRLRGPIGQRAGWAFLTGLLVTGVIECLQLIVFTRYTDVTDVLTGSLAVLGGWALGRAFMLRTEADKRRPRSEGTVWRPVALGAALVAWVGVLAAITWNPYDFLSDPQAIKARLQKVNLIPFADLYWGTEYNAFDHLLQRLVLFMPIGGLVAFMTRRRSTLGWSASVLLGMTISAGLEAGQILIPSRTPGTTDVLLATIASGIGYGLTTWLMKPAAIQQNKELVSA